MKVKLVDAIHPFLLHPGTGLPLVAVGQRTNGSLLWPIVGSDGDEGGDTDRDGEEGDSEDEDGSDEEKDNTGENGDKSKSKTKAPTLEEYNELLRKYEARTKHLSAADKRKSDAEKELEALKRKDQSDLENAQNDLKKVTQEHITLQGSFKKLALVNAFLTASQQEKITWHDPKVAQKAADLDDLEIDVDGNVEGIRDVVKTLAKKSKYLVNVGEEESDEEGKTNGRRGASGSGVGSIKTTKGKGDGKPDKGALMKRFPSLRG